MHGAGGPVHVRSVQMVDCVLNNFVSSFCICILTISCFNLKQLFSPSKLYFFVLSLFYMHELIIVFTTVSSSS